MGFDQFLLEVFQLREDGFFGELLGPRIGLLENAETLGGPQQLDLEFFGLGTAQVNERGPCVTLSPALT